MVRRTALVVSAVAFLSSLAVAAPLPVKGATIAFAAKANVGMVIEGTTSAIVVDEDAKNVTLTVAVGTLTTGVELRDKHMKETYLEAPKFPEAKLVIEKSCLALPEAGEKSGECPAAFTLHGETKGVTVKYKAAVTGKNVDVDANFVANFVDHGVQEPKYMGIKVKPLVDVKAKFSAAR
jgi:polyisoprenoid-binding protein YceI